MDGGVCVCVYVRGRGYGYIQVPVLTLHSSKTAIRWAWSIHAYEVFDSSGNTLNCDLGSQF